MLREAEAEAEVGLAAGKRVVADVTLDKLIMVVAARGNL